MSACSASRTGRASCMTRYTSRQIGMSTPSRSATRRTAEAAVKLLKKLGADVIAACFVIDLPDLGGAKKIEALDVPVRSLIAFEGH